MIIIQNGQLEHKHYRTKDMKNISISEVESIQHEKSPVSTAVYVTRRGAFGMVSIRLKEREEL